MLIIILVLYIWINYIQKCCIENYITEKTHIRNIPKIIYRTHKFSNQKMISKYMYTQCHKKWLDLNPSYSMIWFTDKENDIFMEKMGSRIYNAYKKIKPGAFKADLWRACFLYENGGIYIDSFATPYTSLSLMLQGCFFEKEDQFISVKDVDHIDIHGKLISGIHNGVIIATPKHPFLCQYIKDMVRNIENNYYGEHFLDVTGPFCLMRSINKVNGNYIDKRPKIGKNKGKYNFYLYEFTLDIYQTVYKNKVPIMCKKYSIFSLFQEKILKRKNVYSVMWYNKNIYHLNNESNLLLEIL